MLIGDGSYQKYQSLQKSLEQQQRFNINLSEQVGSLKREIVGLQTDPRTIEKAARNELGMLRPNEVLVIFEQAGDERETEHKGIQK